MKKMRYAISALAVVGMFIATPALADADGTASPSPAPPTAPHVRVVSTAVAAPFNLEIGRRGVLVADGDLNLVGKVATDGSITPLAEDQPGAALVCGGGHVQLRVGAHGR